MSTVNVVFFYFMFGFIFFPLVVALVWLLYAHGYPFFAGFNCALGLVFFVKYLISMGH